MTEKTRLDAALVERGLCTGRDRAKGIIMAGQVYVNNQKADKPGMTISPEDQIEVRGDQLAYVSRGGLKLEKAMKEFCLRLDGCICADIGASTGGFTDCMLQNGAVKVYAIDVGTNQLAWKLRQDERVVSMEKTNIRYVTPEDIADPIDFSSIDVAFISLTKVLIPVWNLLKNGGRVVCLVKPQFEAGREKVGKKGVVRDKKVHEEVVCHIMTYALSMGFEILGLSYSPIKGPEGNIEYLLYIEKPQDAQALTEIAEEADQKAEEQFEQQYLALAKETVEAAHEAFLYHHE